MADKDSERQESAGPEDYPRIVRERAWVIIFAVVVVVLVALYMSLTTTPLYSASARLGYQRNDLVTAVSGYGLNTCEDKDRSIATAELLSSAKMGQVVSELKRMGDYLLIDPPPSCRFRMRCS
jgi:uncharacterized protein involved in exopolysaccharide biosynthesis